MTKVTGADPQTDPVAAAPVEQQDDGEVGVAAISQWEFLDRVPTTEEVMALLLTLPDQWGVAVADFADYVQALPSKKKVKRPAPQRPDLMVDVYLEVHTLYMSVAGRQQMLRTIQEQNQWTVDLVPEPTTPTGMPGFLAWEPRLVYREAMVVTDKDGRRLGSKSGTAWVPYTGGSQAAGSNPFEKVETSARGRALAAWGIGVLPGSGVASVEEILGAGQNRAHIDAEAGAQQGRQGGNGGARRPRGELLQEALAVAEELRQERGIDEEQMRVKIGDFLTKNLGITDAYDPVAVAVDWGKVKDGQLTLLTNSLRDSLRALRDAGTAV